MWDRSHPDQPAAVPAEPNDSAHPERIQALLDQLREARALFREEQKAARQKLAEEKARLASRESQTRALSQAARKQRQRIKALSARFLKRMKEKWSTERLAVEADRAEVLALRERVTLESAELATLRAGFQQEALDYQEKMQSAWDLLQEGQRRLVTDREEAEAWIAEQVQRLDQRSASLHQREHQWELTQVELRERRDQLEQEVQSLETRAQNLRGVLRALEHQRLESEHLHQERLHPTGQYLVPLTPVSDASAHQDAERLMASLIEGEQELVRERQKLQIAREDLARRETALENEKAILAEQIAALSEARQSWNHAELHNLDELETLTRALKAREHAADERDRQAIIQERRRQDQEQELIQLREKMEAWQNALLEHEHAARQAREQANADLEARKSQILNWEQSVEQIIRSWNELREQERTQLRTELDRWTIARQRYEVALTQLDDTRERYLEETRNAAALALSLEEANPTAGPKADRRMRVLRKKWEKHFDRFRNELDKRRAECAADSEEAAERIAELHQMLMQCDEVYAMQHLKQLQRDREFVTSLIHAGESPAPSMLDATVLEQSENARLPDGTRRAA